MMKVSRNYVSEWLGKFKKSTGTVMLCSSAVICISVVFSFAFFIFSAQNFARCERAEEDFSEEEPCFGGTFISAIVLLCFNVALLIGLSRCFCDCFCHGFCNNWKRLHCRRTRAKLDAHPKVKLIYSWDQHNPNPGLVANIHNLVESTWLQEKEHEETKTPNPEVMNKRMQIRYIYEINNGSRLAKYVVSHLRNLKSHQLPSMLIKAPIKTDTRERQDEVAVTATTEANTMGKRTLSEVSLTIQDVVQRTAVVVEPAMVRSRSSVFVQLPSVSEDFDTSYDTLTHQVLRRLSLDLKQKHPRITQKRLSLQNNTLLSRPVALQTRVKPSRSKSQIEPIVSRRNRDATRARDKLENEFKRTASENILANSLTRSRRRSSLALSLESPNPKVTFAFSFDDEGPLCYYMDSDICFSDDDTADEATNQETSNYIQNDTIIEIPEPIIESHEQDADDTKSEGGNEALQQSEASDGKANRRKLKHEALELRPGITRAGEAYLFHGTRLSNVISIIENGFYLDKSKGGLFGKGIYLAENSRKADQYVDDPNNRRSTCLPMFVVRTSLGKVEPHLKKRKENSPDVDTFVAGKGRRFREFIKTDSTQCYPEFLIIYDRVCDETVIEAS